MGTIVPIFFKDTVMYKARYYTFFENNIEEGVINNVYVSQLSMAPVMRKRGRQHNSFAR